MRGWLFAALLCASTAEAKGTAKVSFLEGAAESVAQTNSAAAPTGAWRPLSLGATLNQGDAVRTGPATRLELQLSDGSRVRLAANTTLTLTTTHFGKGERKVSLGLWAGQVWAKVTKLVSGDTNFEVSTHNAVAGVRGTSFAVLAQADASSVVKVYAGTVGVKKQNAAKAGRMQVDGPARVDRKQWEEVITTAMKQVKVSALGEISPLEDFVDQGDQAQWAAWNQERDAAIQ